MERAENFLARSPAGLIVRMHLRMESVMESEGNILLHNNRFLQKRWSNVPRMEDEYLRRVLGDVLVEGLKATALEDPADPIDYLAKWLLRHRDVEDQWAQFREEQEELRESLVKHYAAIDREIERLEKERIEEEERRLREEEEKRLKEEEERKKAEEEEDDGETTADDDDTTADGTTTGYSESLADTF